MTAERIKALREARGWTQAELARRMNMTRNGINSWEQGLSMPSPTQLGGPRKIILCINRLSAWCRESQHSQCNRTERRGCCASGSTGRPIKRKSLNDM